MNKFKLKVGERTTIDRIVFVKEEETIYYDWLYQENKLKAIELSKTLTNFIVSENKNEIDNTRTELNKCIRILFESHRSEYNETV